MVRGLVVAAAGVFAASSALAQPIVPEGFEVSAAYGGEAFNQPVGIVFAPDGRHFIVERGGTIRVVATDGEILKDPLIDISDEVCGTGDLGLLGVALNPEFATDPWIYLLYTVDPDGDGTDELYTHFSRLTRYRPSASNPNVFDPSTREVLIGQTWTDGIPSPHSSHSIGTILFGSDGSLILGSGDGAHWDVTDPGGLDPDSFGPGKSDPVEDIGAYRSRSLNSMAGKILRVDPATGLGLPTNPFWNGDAAHNRSRVWAYGFRNPFRFARRPGTGSTVIADGDPGTLYVGDVGWYLFEELNIVTAPGQNFGWPCREGNGLSPNYPWVTETFTDNVNVLCDEPSNPENPSPNTEPAYWWREEESDSNPPGWVGFSSTGGTFYEGWSFPPEYQGAYFHADYIAGWIRAIEVDADDNIVGWSEFATNVAGVIGVYVEPGTTDLLYLSWFGSQFLRIRFLEPIDVGEPTSPPEIHALAVARNPFRTNTTFSFSLDASAPVEMSVHDVAGRRIRGLVDRTYANGRHFVVWDGTDDAGRAVAPGVYFVHVRSGTALEVARVVRVD